MDLGRLFALWPVVLRVLMNAIGTGQWTDDDEGCLAGLRQEAQRCRLFEPSAGPLSAPGQQARAGTAILLAMGTACRVEAAAGRGPWPEERPGVAGFTAAIAEAEAALGLLAKGAVADPGMAQVAGLMHVHCVRLLVSLGAVRGKSPDLLAAVSAHADQIPAAMARQLPAVAAVKSLAKVYSGEKSPAADDVTAAADEYRNLWDSMGADYTRAEAAANRADASGDPAEIRAAIAELAMVWIGLPAGSPVRGRTLTLLADMQLTLAVSTDDLTLLADAIAIAIAAIRTAGVPRVAQAGASILVDCLAMQAFIGYFEGPLAEASRELRGALLRLDPADPVERAGLLAAAAASAPDDTGDETGDETGEAAPGDGSRRQTARLLATEAVRLLPAAPSAAGQPNEWLLYHRTVRSLFHWTAAQVFSGRDPQLLPAALQVAAKVEGCLAAGTPTADDLSGLQRMRKALLKAERRIQRGKAPVPERANGQARAGAARFETLRGQFPAPLADLRQALAGQFDDTRQRSRAHQELGLRLAELYWGDPNWGDSNWGDSAGAAGDVLRDAITHLRLALATGEFTRPTSERANLLDQLARCYQESGRRGGDVWERHRAERAARAALRELAGCVLTAASQPDARAAAAQAGQIAARAARWCLADGRRRAAVNLAETGRALQLAAVVMAGRAAELLRAAGKDTTDPALALDALWDTPGGPRLLAVPSVIKTSADMATTQLDAVVYLLPPGAPGEHAIGQAMLIRPVTGEVEVVALPRLTTLDGTPLTAYLAALEQAGTVAGLEALGQWAYDTIMGPLLEHARRWRLDGPPHLALIPLGPLGAVPFAAAWTTAPGGGRRYVIEDVVLSYAASARLLGEVASRPRLPLEKQVVFVADPSGTLDFSRRIITRLARSLYPGATVYGLRNSPSGPATNEVVLDALPGTDRPGASLLQLTTHGTLDPVPAVQTYGGWLPLATILDQARDRPPDAPGGLVITTACLTDTTFTGDDESLTLATAFLAAGASAVIGTRWRVEVEGATALTIRLHHHLQDGRLPAEALRRAQLDLLRPDSAVRDSLGSSFADVDDARLSAPASWAGHVHHGV